MVEPVIVLILIVLVRGLFWLTDAYPMTAAILAPVVLVLFIVAAVKIGRAETEWKKW